MARTKSQAKKAASPVKKSRGPPANLNHPAFANQKNTGKNNKSKRKSTSQPTPQKKKKLYRPDARILQEIKQHQKSTNLLIPKLSFSRVVRELMMFFRGSAFRITSDALGALQEAAEAYLVQFFNDAILLALHAKRVTLFNTDMILLKRLRGRNDPCN